MCNFICNNWTDILITFIGAFFGFGLAIFIEYWKTRSDKKKDKKIETEEKVQKIEYYRILLKEVISNSEKQTELINEYIEEQNKNLLYPIPLKRISTNIFIRLKNIDARGVFEALSDRFKTDKDWVEQYNNLNSHLDFLEAVFCEELARINENTVRKAYNDQLYVKKLIDEIPNILSQEAFIKAGQLGERRYGNTEYVFIENSIGEFHRLIDEKSDLEKFNKELLQPLLKKTSLYQTHPYARDVIFNCKNARVRMNDIKNDTKQTISTYKEIVESIKQAMETVNKMIKKTQYMPNV